MNTKGRRLLPPTRTRTIEGYLFEPSHEASKYRRSLMFRQAPQPVERETPTPPAGGIALPAPGPLEMRLGEAIFARRSHRRFADMPLAPEYLSTLLHHAFGTGAYPSAGARYALSVLLLIRRVAGLPDGLYRYWPAGHLLHPIAGDGRALLDSLMPPGQRAELEAAPVFCLLVAHFPEMTAKYGERGYRFCLQECGHMSQNAQLVATALGLGSLVLASYFDDELHAAIGLDGVENAVLTLIPVGHSLEENPLPTDAQGWLSLRIDLPDEDQVHAWLTSTIAPVLQAQEESGILSAYWYLLKRDTRLHLRLRLYGHLFSLRQQLLPALTARLPAEQPPLELIYEPETGLFGGPWCLDQIHDLFYCDSRFLLAWASLTEEERGGISDHQISLIMQQHLLKSAWLDAFERWDVWQKVQALRPGQPEELAPLWEQQQEQIRLLQQIAPDTLAASLSPGAQAAIERYSADLRRIGGNVYQGQHSGRLERGLRQILATAICFHWNRLQFSSEEQQALAYLMERATKPLE